MLKFFMNLFKRRKKDFLEVEVDKEKGEMIIRTDKDLTADDIAQILEEYLGD